MFSVKSALKIAVRTFPKYFQIIFLNIFFFLIFHKKQSQ